MEYFTSSAENFFNFSLLAQIVVVKESLHVSHFFFEIFWRFFFRGAASFNRILILQ
jgi:hypothetical protein